MPPGILADLDFSKWEEPEPTTDLRLARDQVLSPLSYGGKVRAEGFEPPERVPPGYSRPRLSRVGAPAWGGWRVPTPLPPGSQPGALPLSYSHHEYPRQGSNLGPSGCGPDALPLSYTGKIAVPAVS